MSETLRLGAVHGRGVIIAVLRRGAKRVTLFAMLVADEGAT